MLVIFGVDLGAAFTAQIAALTDLFTLPAHFALANI
jgi:hypothetical protein